MFKIYILCIFYLFFGCTDAELTKFTTIGQRAEIICRSGGIISFHGVSTGKVLNEKNSDGYFAKWEIIQATDFKYTKSGDFRTATLSSDCNIIYIEEKKD